ncbi:MAG: sugar transferase [Deltaproteobacteria bacterium]|nr:sugar transferase [Deltaproteobacteria bacterium]
MKEASGPLVRVLHLVDSFCVVLLLWVVCLMKGISEWNLYWNLLAVVAFGLSFITFQAFQVYRPRRGGAYHREFMNLVKAWGAVVGMVVLLLFSFKVSAKFSRAVLMSWFVLTPVLLLIVHMSGRTILRRLRAKGKNQRSAVIVGTGEMARRFYETVDMNRWLGIRIRGFFQNGGNKAQTEDLSKPVLGRIEDLKYHLTHTPTDYVYVALPMREEAQILKILTQCRTLGAQVLVVPDVYGYGLMNARIEVLADFLLLNFNPDSTAKRYFDVVFSVVFLLLTLPVTLLIALLIKLEDGGPIFYGHQRIARAGAPFDCLKFRTMHVNADKKLQEILECDPQARAEWKQTFKLKNDPRITKIGRFLRKTSLDELPQFINVLKGDMSVVGARPIVAEELEDYYKENGALYCSLKPGVTGPWQVGKRSDTEDYEERVRLDSAYAVEHTFLSDLKIIWKTVWSVVRGKGAY